MSIEAYTWARAKKLKHSNGGSVLREIACQADDATGSVRLSISDLMEGVGVSRDTIVNHLAALQSAGHIAINRRHPFPNKYTLIGYKANTREHHQVAKRPRFCLPADKMLITPFPTRYPNIPRGKD